jgi:hypothetical protein
MLKKDPSSSRSFSIPGKEISISLLLSYRAHYHETPHTKKPTERDRANLWQVFDLPELPQTHADQLEQEAPIDHVLPWLTI